MLGLGLGSGFGFGLGLGLDLGLGLGLGVMGTPDLAELVHEAEGELTMAHGGTHLARVGVRVRIS